MAPLPPLVTCVREAALRLGMRGRGVLIAVSGGPDSVALLLALAELAEPLGITLAAASLDHGLRRGSRADCLSAARLCRRLGIPCTVRKISVRGEAGIEAAARRARYRALAEIADERGLALIATGHTLEDQAETVLLRLARGAGVRGLRGILEKRGRVVRPMLKVSRAEVKAYLAVRRVVARQDPTNASPRFARNRVRAQVLPALTRALGKGALACVARAAAIAGEDERYLERRAGKAFARLFAPKGGALEGEAGALCRLHPALRRRVLRRAARALGASLGASHVEAIERALGAAGPARLTLPRGFECRIAYGRIVLAKAEERARAQPFAQRIDGPGEVEAGGFVVEVRPVEGPAKAGTGGLLRVDPERVALPLWLRSRRPGDRYRPRGGHEKKLKALFIDQKIPRAERDRLPLLCDDTGRVLWALGLRPSDAAAQGERSRKAWLICVRASEASPRALLEGKAGETGPKRGAK